MTRLLIPFLMPSFHIFVSFGSRFHPSLLRFPFHNIIMIWKSRSRHSTLFLASTHCRTRFGSVVMKDFSQSLNSFSLADSAEEPDNTLLMKKRLGVHPHRSTMNFSSHSVEISTNFQQKSMNLIPYWKNGIHWPAELKKREIHSQTNASEHYLFFKRKRNDVFIPLHYLWKYSSKYR